MKEVGSDSEWKGERVGGKGFSSREQAAQGVCVGRWIRLRVEERSHWQGLESPGAPGTPALC